MVEQIQWMEEVSSLTTSTRTSYPEYNLLETVIKKVEEELPETQTSTKLKHWEDVPVEQVTKKGKVVTKTKSVWKAGSMLREWEPEQNDASDARFRARGISLGSQILKGKIVRTDDQPPTSTDKRLRMRTQLLCNLPQACLHRPLQLSLLASTGKNQYTLGTSKDFPKIGGPIWKTAPQMLADLDPNGFLEIFPPGSAAASALAHYELATDWPTLARQYVRPLNAKEIAWVFRTKTTEGFEQSGVEIRFVRNQMSRLKDNILGIKSDVHWDAYEQACESAMRKLDPDAPVGQGLFCYLAIGVLDGNHYIWGWKEVHRMPKTVTPVLRTVVETCRKARDISNDIDACKELEKLYKDEDAFGRTDVVLVNCHDIFPSMENLRDLSSVSLA